MTAQNEQELDQVLRQVYEQAKARGGANSKINLKSTWCFYTIDSVSSGTTTTSTRQPVSTPARSDDDESNDESGVHAAFDEQSGRAESKLWWWR